MIGAAQRAGESAGAGTRTDDSGITTTTLGDLQADTRWHGPVLLPRHVLLLVTAGHGSQEVDFRRLPCRPGTALRGRPGQLVRGIGAAGFDGVALCWDDRAGAGVTAALAALDDRADSGHWQLTGEDEDAVISEVSQLEVDCRRHAAAGLAPELLRQQLTVLLLRLAVLAEQQAPDDGPGAVTYRRLRRELELSYDRTRRAEDYADRLGCSVRTLTRACLAATGRSAKQVIDARVALEARRLLAATDEPVADIGRRLGFPEPTNFGRFFHREAGSSPGAFRAALGRPAPDVPGRG
ncbi:helix-turn-helix transcriptional regulator [Plantactinospora siamensis]|uniref:Helix-turn-helix transcriptional regulator n=1 Tax=Plantactinospora siamensis TaxID=555372 RepID=A0ABV6NYL9_9ACTN